MDEKCKEHHTASTEYEHHDKVSRLTSERTLLQHSAVAIREYYVEEEIEAHRPEKKKRCQHSPYLIPLQYQDRVEVQLER